MTEAHKKAWSGRFKQKTHPVMEAFNDSLPIDYKLYPYDIQGSIAHARMLGRIGVLTRAEAARLERALSKIKKEIDSGLLNIRAAGEDIHMAIEAELTKRLGALGAKLHTARSRNDQVACDLRLYCCAQIRLLDQELKRAQKSLVQLAGRHGFVPLPGYTHLQRAQPILWAHQLIAYAEMLDRDRARLKDALQRTSQSPLGAGALAGTTFPVDRAYTAKQLGFDGVMPNSLDAVSDRDFVLELLFVLSVIMTHLSRFAEEMVLWNSQEFGFIILPEGFCTGSSMMPQKVNPDVFELIRGKTGRVYGHLFNLLTTIKALPLTYNKDFQEDKPALFDGVEQVLLVLTVLNEVLPLIRPNVAKMALALKQGFVLATDLAEYLVTRGIPFREAHEMVGRMVQYCVQQQKGLEDLTLDEFKRVSPHIEQSVYQWLDIQHALSKRSSVGGTAPNQIRKALRALQQRIG